jgi:hypothetical protein
MKGSAIYFFIFLSVLISRESKCQSRDSLKVIDSILAPDYILEMYSYQDSLLVVVSQEKGGIIVYSLTDGIREIKTIKDEEIDFSTGCILKGDFVFFLREHQGDVRRVSLISGEIVDVPLVNEEEIGFIEYYPIDIGTDILIVNKLRGMYRIDNWDGKTPRIFEKVNFRNRRNIGFYQSIRHGGTLFSVEKKVFYKHNGKLKAKEFFRFEGNDEYMCDMFSFNDYLFFMGNKNLYTFYKQKLVKKESILGLSEKRVNDLVVFEKKFVFSAGKKLLLVKRL